TCRACTRCSCRARRATRSWPRSTSETSSASVATCRRWCPSRWPSVWKRSSRANERAQRGHGGRASAREPGVDGVRGRSPRGDMSFYEDESERAAEATPAGSIVPDEVRVAGKDEHASPLNYQHPESEALLRRVGEMIA